MQRTLRVLMCSAVLSIAASCGGDDDAATDTSTSTPETAAAAADVSTESASFPVTIDHKYGATTIEAEPQRVVSIGFGEHDNLLAIGVTPVAVRDWYGDQPYATWPWAQDELGGAEPEVLSSEALNFEQIAALAPDLIVGIASGMTEEDYATLSAIAPTVAQPADYIDYGTPWDVALEMMGRATGHRAEAEARIADTRQLFADAVEAHPEFDGATAAVTFFYDGQPGAYAASDPRSRFLSDLGFVIPDSIDAAAGDAFYVSISSEDLSLIDTDVVVWIAGDDTAMASIRDLPTRPTMRAYDEGRELAVDVLLSGAFSHAGPLAYEYVLEELVPELALAVDGDPATPVPSAAAIRPAGSVEPA